MSGCTHNNGDIGPWFGTWQVTGIDADGAPLAEYDGMKKRELSSWRSTPTRSQQVMCPNFIFHGSRSIR